MLCRVILLNPYTLRLRSNLRRKDNRQLGRIHFDIDIGFMFIKIADTITVYNTAVFVDSIFLGDRDSIAVCLGIGYIFPACAFVYLPLQSAQKACRPFSFC